MAASASRMNRQMRFLVHLLHFLWYACMLVASLEATLVIVKPMYSENRSADEHMPSKYIHHSLGTSSALDPFGRLVINVIPCPFVPIFTEPFYHTHFMLHMPTVTIDC
jgi:hypothetical protein